MTYIRHRQRMIQESVYQDLRDTLITCRWFIGTTSQPVINVNNANTIENVTTVLADVYPLASRGPIELLDAFPEDPSAAQPNTMAMDQGVLGESTPWEMGNSGLREQPYIVTIALLAENDALGAAVFSDLRDRYEGRLVRHESIPLIDYLTDPNVVVGYLEVEAFRWSPDLGVSNQDGRLFIGELSIVDFVE